MVGTVDRVELAGRLLAVPVRSDPMEEDYLIRLFQG
jgi:hypothetical protein